MLGSHCGFYIYLNSDRKVDFLRVLGNSQSTEEKCGREMERQESQTERKSDKTKDRNRKGYIPDSLQCFLHTSCGEGK